MTDHRPFDQIIADIRTRREVLELIEADLRQAKQELAEAEDELLAAMNDQGTRKVESQGLTITISESIVPTVKDWSAFEKFVLRNKALFLLERRVHTTAWREALEERQGTAIPGVEPYTRIRLSVRAS